MILKIIGIVIVLAVVVVLVLAAMKPDTFAVTRTATIKAPPGKIYPHIVDLKAWGAWSPWEKKDPNLKRTFSGAAQGVGAVYEWEGDKNVGTGRMEIVEAAPDTKVGIKLDFLKPFEAHNRADFVLAPSGDSTTVTWTMSGPLAFIHKVMHVLFNMDKMVGNDFEAGLASLKAIAEK